MKLKFFKELCEDLGAEHTLLLFYCNSCLLSRGNTLARVYELRKQLKAYFLTDSLCEAEKFKDTDLLLFLLI